MPETYTSALQEGYRRGMQVVRYKDGRRQGTYVYDPRTEFDSRPWVSSVGNHRPRPRMLELSRPGTVIYEENKHLCPFFGCGAVVGPLSLSDSGSDVLRTRCPECKRMVYAMHLPVFNGGVTAHLTRTQLLHVYQWYGAMSERHEEEFDDYENDYYEEYA